MSPLFEKLNLNAHTEILAIDVPPSFEPALAALRGVSIVRDPLRVPAFGFAIAFATRQAEVDRLTALLVPKATGDAVWWFAYPKGTSKNHTCDFNRDTGWSALRAAGFDTVREVAIDADWSALRFRRVAFINTKGRRVPDARAP